MMATLAIVLFGLLALTIVSLTIWTVHSWRVLRRSRPLTDTERQDIEMAVRAFACWPFDRGPFIWIGTQAIGAAVVRYCIPTDH